MSAQEVPSVLRALASQSRLTTEVSLESSSPRGGADAVVRSAKRGGGFVTVSECRDTGLRRSLRLPTGTSLADSLDMIVSLDQSHYWTIEGEVVNVLPNHNMPEVMRTIIANFEWNTADTIQLTIQRLSQVDEIRTQIKKWGGKQGVDVGIGLQKPPRIIAGQATSQALGEHREARGLNFLLTLNRIVASYGTAFWWYEERTCGDQKTFEIGGH